MAEKFVPGELIIKENVKSRTSGNEYIVCVFDNCMFCTCPAGGKKQLCKHTIEVIHKNLELLKEKCPEFLKKLMRAIEVKNDKSIKYENKFAEYAKVIYLNKEIVDESIKNIEGLEHSDIVELTQFAPLVFNYRLFELYEFLNLSRKSLYNLFFVKNDELFQKLEALKFIKFHELSLDDFLKNVSYTNKELKELLKSNNIKVHKDTKKEILINLIIEHNLFDTEMKKYSVISATELFATSKDIRSFLYKNRSKYIKNKKVLQIKFLREDCTIEVS